MEDLQKLAMTLQAQKAETQGSRSLVAALSSLNQPSYDPSQPTTFMANVGSFGTSKAYALGLNHFPSGKLAIHSSVAFGASGNKRTVGNIGLVLKTGNGSTTPERYGKTVERQVALLQTTLLNLEERLQAINEELNKAEDNKKSK